MTQALARDAQVQLIVATHSPLVMASAEPRFDEALDAWFDLDLAKVSASGPAQVQLVHRPFERLGDVSSWLVSEAFDLPSARSREAEALIAKAEALVQARGATPDQALQLTNALEGVLGGTDPFWARWRMAGAHRGWWDLPQPSSSAVLPQGRSKGKAP